MEKKTTVANFHHIEQLGPDDAYIGRAGKGFKGYFGNPFSGPDRLTNVMLYKEWFYKRLDSDGEFWYQIHALKGKRLVCFCAPKDCHGDIIANYLNNGG